MTIKISRYAYDDGPTEHTSEQGKQWAKTFIARALAESYPNEEYETPQEVLNAFKYAAEQCLDDAKTLVGNDPAYLENYTQYLRSYIAEFDAVLQSISDTLYRAFIAAEHARVEQKALLQVLRAEQNKAGESARYATIGSREQRIAAIRAARATYDERITQAETELEKCYQASDDAWRAYEKARGI